MKKILAAFDGTKYSEGASEYAIQMAKATGSMLVGAFIQDLRYLNFTYAYAFDQPFIDYSSIEKSSKEELEKIDLNIKLFNRACDEAGVHHKVHFDKGIPLQEVIRESLFADVLILDSHTGFFSFSEHSPSPFLKDLMADAHCPVMIVPHYYSEIRKTILCYDGNPSSVYAIKMFAYLLPEFSVLDTTVVSVNDHHAGNHLRDGSNFKELVKQHYSDLTYEVAHGKAEEKLLEIIKENGENTLVVLGAYGRNSLSRLFHESLSNRIIKDLNVPVFITHQ